MTSVREIMSSSFIALDKSETVSSLIGKLKETGMVQACITDGKEPVGIFSHHLLLKSRVDVARLKLAKVAVPAPQLSPNDDLMHAAGLLHDADAAMLPVVENGRLVGVVHALDALKHLRDIPDIQDLTVGDIRHPEPMTMHEEESIDAALSLMHDLGLDRLPVVDDRGRISGFLSYKEVLENYYAHRLAREYGQKPHTKTRAFEAERPDVPELPVRDFMSTREIVSISEEDPLKRAIERMVLERVHSLLILDDRIPRHIIDKKDILEAIINSQVPENRDIKYVGLERLDIDSYTRLQIAKITSRHFEKLQRMARNSIELTVHIKERQREGHRHRYSILLRTTYPGATIPSSHALAWDVRTALQDAFTRLESNLANNFKRNKKESFSERRGGRPMPGTDALEDGAVTSSRSTHPQS